MAINQQEPPDNKDTWAGAVRRIVEIGTESWGKLAMVLVLALALLVIAAVLIIGAAQGWLPSLAGPRG